MGKSTKATAGKSAAKKSTAAKHKVQKSGKGVGVAGMKILNAVAGLRVTMKLESVERSKLSFHTEITGKSTIANALTKLKEHGWMVVTPKTVSITDDGMENADQEEMARLLANVPKTNKEFWKTVIEKNNLKGNMLAFFEALQDGRTHKKKDVILKVFGKANSTSANACTFLKKCGIVEYDSTTIRLTDDMFQVEDRPEE